MLQFDTTFYLTTYPDVAAAISRGTIASAQDHYNNFGRFESRNPNAFFDTAFYLAQNPDVAAARVNPLQHFIQFGAAEGRFANNTADASLDANNNNRADEFNATAYLQANPDVAANVGTGKAFASAYQHFILFGQFEGRAGGPAGGPFTNSGIAQNTGSALALTTGADSLTGTNANDTFTGFVSATAANSTLSATDTIRGGAGVDTLNIVVADTATATTNGADIQGIEIVNVRSTGGGAVAIDASTVPGATQINADRGTGTLAVTNLGAGAAVGVIGNGTAANGNVTFAYAAAAPAVTLNLSGGTLVGTTVSNSNAAAAVTTATINSTGAANVIGALQLDGSTVTNEIKTLNVNATTNLTATLTADDFASDATLNVSGSAGSVDLGVNFDGAKINASGLTAGGLTIGLNANTTSFVGGQGNDVVTTAAFTSNLAASAINAGAGTADRLVVADSAHVDTAVEAQQYAGFEVLQVGAGVAANAALFTNSSINAVRFTGSGTVNGLNATQAGNVTITADATATLGVTNAATVGQIDTVKITVDDGATAVNTVTLANVNAAGVENLQFVANDKIAVTALTGSTAVTSVNVSGTQDVSITTGGLALNANTTVDASALTGKFTFSAAAATGGNGVSIVGSSTAANTLTGSGQVDKIVGGAGDDVITGGAGADTLTGGAGKDAFVFASAAHSTGTSFDTITDLNLGTNVAGGAVDGLRFVNAGGTVSVVTLTAAQQTTVTGSADLATAATNALAAGTAAAQDGLTVQFNFGSDTYIVHNTDANLTFNDGTDYLVRVTGVTGTLDASDVTIFTV